MRILCPPSRPFTFPSLHIPAICSEWLHVAHDANKHRQMMRGTEASLTYRKGTGGAEIDALRGLMIRRSSSRGVGAIGHRPSAAKACQPFPARRTAPRLRIIAGMRTCRTLGLILLGFSLAACSSSTSPQPRSAIAATSEVTVTPTTESSSTADVVSAAPVSLTCAPTGDAPFSEASVFLEPIGQDVSATWQWVGSPPETGTFGLFVTLDGPKGDDMHQLGFKMQDGTPIGFFDFDMASAQQRNLGNVDAASITSTGAHLTFSESTAPFASGFTATGAVSVDGDDVMTCT